ncbi:MAG: lysoplasmalogenase [Microthrixaceae bacterium]
MFYVLLGLTLVLAAVNWWAAHTGHKPIEYFFKPATMVALGAAALSIADPVPGASNGHTIRMVMVLGLLLSMIGDICLMLGSRWFLQGLVAFLLAHIAYIVGLALVGVLVVGLVLGIIVVGVSITLIAPRIVAGARLEDPRMGVAVSVYMTVIAFMVIVAFGTGSPWAAGGALLFFASDGCIGWDKFVKPLPLRHLLVMVTYHLGQIGLVLSLMA